MATFAMAVPTPAVEDTSNASPKSELDVLFEACGRGDVDTIRQLQLTSASFAQLLQSFRTDGRTPLHVAVASNQPAVVECLLAAGADPNFPDDSVRRFGRSALHEAIAEHRGTLLPILFAHQASVTQTDKFSKNAIHVALEAEAVEDDILAVLLAQPDANISLQDESGRTAIHTALLTLDENERFESIVATLLKRPEFRPTLVDKNGNSVLHLAAQQGMESVFTLCLARSVPLNAQNQWGQTALHVLVKAGYGMDEAKTLLEAPACNLTLQDKKGLTVKDYAERYGDADLVDYFYSLAHPTASESST